MINNLSAVTNVPRYAIPGPLLVILSHTSDLEFMVFIFGHSNHVNVAWFQQMVYLG